MMKGFTLIELLAVIVILAIIALIATPIVLGIIDDAKESAQIRSAEMYLNGVSNAIMKENLEQDGNFRPTECTITNEGNLECDDKEGILEVEVDGEKPKNGTIAFVEGKIKEVRLEYQNAIIVKNEEGNLVYSDAESELGSENDGLNEYGFYFDKAYVNDSDYGYMFKKDGSYYVVSGDNLISTGFEPSIYSQGAFASDGGKGWTATFSPDGKTMTDDMGETYTLQE